MKNIYSFLDKNYFYIIIFFVFCIIGGSIFVLKSKNNSELTKKIGDQYFSVILNSNNGEFAESQISLLKKISLEKNNYGSLASILLSNISYKKKDFILGDDELMRIINDRNDTLSNYALYSYGHILLTRLELQKFAEIIPKLSSKSNVFYQNNIELLSIYHIYLKDYKNALKIIDENVENINSHSLKMRLEDIRKEIKNYIES